MKGYHFMSDNLRVPMDLFYTEDHTWILVEDNIGTVGLTDYAQNELGDIVYVELPIVGSEVLQGSSFGTIEAMKTVAELISPVSGEVVEVNEAIELEPRLVNTEPYGEGWLIRINIHDNGEIDSILTPHDYIITVSGDE